MRILAIHLCNLNSLAGSWAIDFTAPEYAATGIFAITGPTGAGKSTLLDAIALALYGRTPRLGSITKGNNEIMSRQAGDCFAEVSFSTNSGQYRCHWGQHRARRRAGAELQTPRHEIVDLASGKVLESRSREVVRMVEQVTGMDYDRFTRSILLAQGDFAAFLDADADQRAPILEQITGTGIYSRLSIAAHERTSEERKKNAALQEALGTLKLLSPEEEQEIAAAVDENTNVAVTLRGQQEQVQKNLQALSQIQALKGQLKETEEGLVRLSRQRQEAKAEEQRLEFGQRAQTLVPLQTTLTHLTQQILALEQKDRHRLLSLQALHKAQQELQKEHDLACRHLQEIQATRERESERIKEVRALDLQLHEKNKAIAHQTAVVAQWEKQRQTLGLERKKLQQQLTGLREQLVTLHRFFDEQAADALLVEQFAGLRQQLLQLSAKQQERDRLQQVLADTAQQLKGLAKQQQQLDQGVDQAARTLETYKQQQQRLHQQRNELLGDQPMAERRRELTELELRLRQLERGGEWAGQQRQLEQEHDLLKEQEVQLNTRQKQLQEQLHHLEAQHQLNQQLVLQCEKNHQLSLRIRSFEKERGQLEEGSPCPLCGATHHPWQAAQPHIDDRENELAQAREGLEHNRRTIGTQQQTLAALSRDLEHIAQARAQNTKRRDELAQQILPLLAEHALGPVATCVPAIAGALTTLRQQIETLRGRISAIEEVDGSVHKLSTRLEQATNLHLEATQRAQANRQMLATREHDIRNLHTRLEETDTWLVNAGEDLQRALHPFGCAEMVPQGSQQLINTLEARRTQWKARSATQEKLVQQERQLVSLLDRQDLQNTNLETQINNQAGEIEGLRQQYTQLHHQRCELYGELDPNVEEQRVHSRVQQAESRELTARNKRTANEKEVHSLSEQQRLDREELAVLHPQKAAQEGRLLERVQASGFADLEAFCAAILPPETLQQLAETKQRLEQQQALLTARREELNTSLLNAGTNLDHTRSQPELEKEKETLQQQLEALQQRIGADRQRLAANQRLAQEFELQYQKLTAHKQELERWELLHQLIGSADGKKFRVFAQGLTFEVMVSHANRQLRKMSDRYILLRDPKEPLALQVIDNYQAGEIRSTRNLSGGESFLVSLALSLGLSAMASHNVRVDSLFLDEGFGTLDEETLDTALQTLAELQQDGKLIGIISHVTLLKERINLRIQVQPGTDGCSRLVGPGCAQLT